MAAADPHVRVVHHPVNRKLGGSIKTGFADGHRRPRAVHRRRPALRHGRAAARRAGCCATTRPTSSAPTGSTAPARAPSRAVYTFFYNVLIRLLFGVRIRDINFAFKLCRRRVFDHITLHSEGSFIDAELIIRATQAAASRHPVRRRLLPAHPGRQHAVVAGGHPQAIVARCCQLRSELRGIRTASSDDHRTCRRVTVGCRRSRPSRSQSLNTPRPSHARGSQWAAGQARRPEREPVPDAAPQAHRGCRPGRRGCVLGVVVVAGVACWRRQGRCRAQSRPRW